MSHTMKLSGKIDFDTVVSLCRQGEQQIAANAVVDFDFVNIERANSAVLALLLAWQRAAIRAKKQVRFINLPDSVQALIKLCRLETVIETKV